MYKEGLQMGDNSYILSDEEGELTVINGTCTSQEMQEYIKLQNKYEEKTNEKIKLHRELIKINKKEKDAKLANLVITFSLFIIEGALIVLGFASLPLIEAIKVFGIPVVAALIGVFIIKPIKYGTKKKRIQQKAESNLRLEMIYDEIKEIEKEKRKYKEKIENVSYLLEDETIPVITVENKKVNVKMRVLRIDQSR